MNKNRDFCFSCPLLFLTVPSNMSDQDQYQRELDVIEEVKDKGPAGKFFGYAKISGPGWLQGAITLG
ncbi:MAG: hypothetical protein CBC46_05610, partial [Verrucomicrobiaceae bacterium TMED86]